MDVVYLQETKLKDISQGLILSLRVGRSLDWVALNAEGASGGIVVFWDSRVLQLISRRAGFLFHADSKLLKIVFNGSLQASMTQQW